MKNKKMIITAVALVAVIGILLGVYFVTRPQPTEGVKNFTVTVVHSDGSSRDFKLTSSEEFLAPALMAEEIINDEGVETGMYYTVDGETASWEVNQSYWAIYEGEAYANDGLNTLAVRDGAVYKLVYTIG